MILSVLVSTAETESPGSAPAHFSSEPGQWKSLLLSAGDSHATLSQDRLVTILEINDIFVDVRHFRSQLHLTLVRLIEGKADVSLDGIGKKELS